MRSGVNMPWPQAAQVRPMALNVPFSQSTQIFAPSASRVWYWPWRQ